MTLRVTPHRQLQLSQAFAQKHLSNSNRLQNQISSGERIHRPSEDPEGQRIILNQQQVISRLEIQVGSLNHARGTLNQANVEVLDANQLVVQAKSLALQARQATEPSERDVIAAELDGFLKTLESIANSQFNGRYLFGGAKNDTPPYSGVVNGPTSYHGSAQRGEVVLQNEAEITAYRAGSEVFQFVNTEGNGRIDLFDTIRTLRDDLKNFDSFPTEEWGTRVDQRIDELEQSSDHLLKVIGSQSVSLQQLDRIQTRAEDLIQQAQTVLSETQSPDFATAITQLQEEQNLMQFTLATVTRLFDLSVLDFLS